MEQILRRGVRDRSPLFDHQARRKRTQRSAHQGEKKCIKCRHWKPLAEFGSHNDTEDGHQSICSVCKNIAGKKRRDMNTRARLRHHMSTRITSQLGPHTPVGLTKDLEEYLGYTMSALVKSLRALLARDHPGLKLRNCLNEGWHIDHIYPLSKFNVIPRESGATVDWEEFKRCWSLSNLVAIPAEVNLAKGAKIETDGT